MCKLSTKPSLLTLREVEAEEGERGGSNLLKKVINNLRVYGFGKDLDTLDSFLAENETFIPLCNKLLPYLPEKKAIIIITESKEFIWNFHSYFPALFAINFLGKSVYRTTVKLLIDRLLDKEKSDSLSDLINQNLIVFSDLLRGDNRITSMESSIEGSITPILYTTRKMIFTAQSLQFSEKEAGKEVMYKIRTLYSPEMESVFRESVRPIFIRTCAGDNLWP